ncbi:hypothetical protein [Demequina gelatinilytica]|uniref:hypothetical protein n=1 Tax=Demequina gelatinilytica TaxID=1638980 RepID=UPI000780BF74|nr:hypothetical protein [Demequina gelatinilytica]
MNMTSLHKAAAKRAYRTLAQGLGSSTVTTAITAVVTDGKTALAAAGIALGTTVVTAFASFWQGVAKGLPEADRE